MLRSLVLGLASCLGGAGIATAATASLPISANTTNIESELSAFYYGSTFQDSLLVTSDGSAATGGFRTFSLGDDLHEEARRTPGRTNVVGVMYDVGVGQRDVIVSIAATDSIVRVFDIEAGADGPREIPAARKEALGDWAALCTWRSRESGGHYFYLFGKTHARQFLVRQNDAQIEVLEVGIKPHIPSSTR